MSRKKHRKHQPREGGSQAAPAAGPVAAAAPPAAQSAPDPGEFERKLDDLLARGQDKAAVDLAKTAYKQSRTEALENLLVRAYRARIAALAARGLKEESRALEAQVRDRHGAAWQRPAGSGDTSRFPALEEALRPLLDPELEAEARARLEARVATLLTRPALLARCEVLPPEHPWRKAALAVQAAFDAVVAGPVADELIALPEVSRRGPLAPWKLLIRAIASFYRREDEACRKALAALDPASVPARLVPALERLLDGKDAVGLPASSARLMRAIRRNAAPLRAALLQLDKSFTSAHPNVILRGLEEAVALCRELRPELVLRLRQHLSIKCFLLQLPANRVLTALGGPTPKDAYGLALQASALETQGELPLGCPMWAAFVEQAVAEKWFSRESPEAAAVYLRLAEILTQLSALELGELQCDHRFSWKLLPDGQLTLEQAPPVRRPRAGRGGRQRAPVDLEPERFFYLYPEALFERACRADPIPRNFESWLAWARKNPPQDRLERAALAWQAALPADCRPCLALMESAERAGRFDEALAHQAHAEERDPLAPRVRKARVRLLFFATVEGLSAKKAAGGLAALESLAAHPLAAEGDYPAVVLALRSIAAALAGNVAQARALEAQLGEFLGEPTPAWVLISALLYRCKLAKALPRPPCQMPEPSAALLTGTARVAAALNEFGLVLGLSPSLEEPLKQSCLDSHPSPELMLALGEAALCSEMPALAYVLSGPGLAGEGELTARSLLLRVRGLQTKTAARDQRRDCLLAALALARRAQAPDVASQALELLETDSRAKFDPFGRPPPMRPEDQALSASELSRILTIERQRPEPPEARGGRKKGARRCPKCGGFHAQNAPCRRPPRPVEAPAVVAPPSRSRPPAEPEFSDLGPPGAFDEGISLEDFEMILPEFSKESGLPPKLLRLIFEAGLKNPELASHDLDPERLAQEDPALFVRIMEQLSKLSPAQVARFLGGAGAPGRRGRRK
jgi:hypothetical protein